MLSRIFHATAALAFIVIFAILTMTDPSKAGPIGILSLFLCIYIVVVYATTWALYFINQLINKLRRELNFKKTTQLSLKKAYYYATVIGLGPVLLLGMQSVSGVGLYELGLIGLLLMLGCIYIARKMP